MVGKYPVITLCGSTRFNEQFLEAQKRLTLAGNIVISVGLFGHSGDDEVWVEGTKEMLDDKHKRKIDLADGNYVCFPNSETLSHVLGWSHCFEYQNDIFYNCTATNQSSICSN